MREYKYVYIIVETVAREMDSTLLFTSELIDKGFKVVIMSQLSANKFLFSSPAGVVIDKGYGDNHQNFFLKLKQSGHRIIVNRSEPIVYNKIRLNFEFKSFKHDPSYLVDKFFSIGNDYRDDLISNGLDESKIVITGNPRFNLLNKTNRIYLINRFKQQNFKFNNYILFVGNFPNLIKGITHSSDDMFEPVDFIRDNSLTDEELILENDLRGYRTRVFASMLNLIKYLLNEFPDIDLVYRPHPSEDKTRLKKIFFGYKNFHIIYEGTAAEWIYGALASIQHNCTTGIEAFILDKPSIYFSKIESEIFDNAEVKDLSFNINTEEGVVNFIESRLSLGSNNYYEKEFTDKANSTLIKYISYLEANQSIKKMTNVISEVAIISSQELKKNKYILSSRLFNLIYKIIFSLKRLLSYLLYKNMLIQQNKGFNKKYIKRIIQSFDGYFPLNTYTLDEVYPEAFLFEKL